MLPRTPTAPHLGVRQPHRPAFRAGNVPLTRAPRPLTPYVRPGRIDGHAAPSSTASSGSGETVIELFHKLTDEIHRGREEYRAMSEDIKGIRQTIGKLEANYRKLLEDWKEQSEASFTIESSQYKEGLVKESGILFAKSLTRQPSREEIGQSVLKVLGQEGRNKFKFDKAKTFCLNRLTDLRCEERRRLFGNKPCEMFPQLTTEKFVDRLLGVVKASNDNKAIYLKHVALLRKFSREAANVRSDTYKKFRGWIKEHYPEGLREEDWDEVMGEDSEYDYLSQSPEVGACYEIEASNCDVGGYEAYDSGLTGDDIVQN